VRHRRPKHGPYRMSSEYSFLVVWAWARVSIAVFVIVDASAVSDKRIKHHECFLPSSIKAAGSRDLTTY
jgi:hypothetical protein